MEVINTMSYHQYYKSYSLYLFACVMTGIVLCFCDIKQPGMNLDGIKNNEHLNLLLSCLADLLGFITLIIHGRNMRSENIEKKQNKEVNKKNDIFIFNPQKFNDKCIFLLVLFTSILDFLDKILILIWILFKEDKKVLDTKFVWMLSFDYTLRSIVYLILKKLGHVSSFPNIFILNCLLLFANGSFSLCYSYWGKPSIQTFQLIIIGLRILIIVIMDNVNRFIFIMRGYHPSRFLFWRGVINSVLFVIFSTILYFYSKNGKEWVFSFLSNINLEYSGIVFILLKILYTISFGIQKYAFLMILYEEIPILASFARMIYFVEPYISKAIMKFLYDKDFQIPLFQIIFEIISILFILFALFTSIELIIMPYECLKKNLKVIVAKRAELDMIDMKRVSNETELDQMNHEEEEEEKQDENRHDSLNN